MNVVPIKRASTFFLKAVLIVIAVAVTTLCAFFFPMLWVEIEPLRQYTQTVNPGLIGFYLTLIPFLCALYQAFKLLHYIDKNNAFSELSVKALRNITYAAIAMSILYMTAMPMVAVFAELDDAPGAILMAFAFACSPLIIATFAAVLQKLVQNAIDLKAENDLTI